MLGRGACPHASAHTASLLMLDLLKHLKGDAFVGGGGEAISGLAGEC